MAYAGICFSDDTQPHTDPYFSQRTQDEFTARATAAPTAYSEQQKYVLRTFDATDSFTLTFPGAGSGSGTTATIANGSNYTVAGIDTAITAVAGGDPTVSAVTANGFTVTWAGTADYRTPTLNVVSGVFSGFGNAIVNGGPGTNNGSVVATSTNHAPVVVAPVTRTIPIRTPFELTGSGNDADGDPLLYLWEQNDIGATAGSLLINGQRQFGPLFRVLGKYAAVSVADSQMSPSPHQNLATTSPTRTFPDIDQIIAGSTNAKNGTCPLPPATYTDPTTALPDSPALDCYSELLPMAGYLGDGPYVPTPLDAGFPDVVPPRNPLGMRFRLTGRDNGGTDGGVDGGYGFSEVVLDIDPTAGPFLVSSQGTATTVAGDAPGTIAWDTARTDTLGLADNVSITLSTDGGHTYPITLLASTPNDGTQAITWPNVATTTARVKVAAVDNYFFDINDADITITANPALTLAGNTPGTFDVQYSDTPSPAPFITATSATVDGGTIAAVATGLPAGLALTKVSSSAAGVRPGTARFEVTGTATGATGSFPVSVSVTDGAATAQAATFTVVVTQEAASASYTGPTTVPAAFTDTSKQFTMTAQVAEAPSDATVGDITTATVTFTDTATSTVLCADAPVTLVSAGVGTASCSVTAQLPADDDRTYQVALAVAGRYTGASQADAPVVVEQAEEPTGDTTPPETSITSGPRRGSFALARQVTLGYASSETPSTFACSLNGKVGDCSDDTLTVRSLKAGSYDFSVTATDGSANTDASPAVRRFYVPVNDGAFTRSKGWKHVSAGSSYRGDYTTAATKGAELRFTVSDATSLALVATKGPGYGAVDVFLGQQKLRTIRLNAGTESTQVLSALTKFGTPTDGVVRIVAVNGKPVRIDGLGVRTATRTTFRAAHITPRGVTGLD